MRPWNNRCNGERLDLFEEKNNFWHITLTLLLDHLNGMTRSRKVGFISVIMDEEDKTIVSWVMGMQACGLSIMF